MSKLIFKYSTMNSGKTIDLIRTVYNYEENNCKVLVMKPLVDTKGGNNIVTRIGLEKACDILIGPSDSILNLLEGNLNDVRCIFIDEAQFLSTSQVDELFLVTKVLDIPVICYGLRNNFKMNSFEGSRRLLEIADNLEEFKTLCYCGETARYCGRKINGEFVTSGNDVLIDGTSNVCYVPLCGKHYLTDVKKIDFESVKKLVKKY